MRSIGVRGHGRTVALPTRKGQLAGNGKAQIVSSEVVIDESSKLRSWETRTEWPLAAVAVVFLAVYSIQVLLSPSGDWARALSALTVASWIAFAADYVVRLAIAPQRFRWFYRHLFDLAIVALPLLRPLRLLRLVVLVGALQKAVGGAIRGRVVIYTVTSAVLLIYVASLAILDTERSDPDAGLRSFGEALWWSITTVTTVGYGDYSPVTGTGRVIAVLLMIGGVSIIGVVTATLASWIVQRVAEEDTTNQAATAAHFAELRDEIQTLRDLIESAVVRHEPPSDQAGSAKFVGDGRRA